MGRVFNLEWEADGGGRRLAFAFLVSCSLFFIFYFVLGIREKGPPLTPWIFTRLLGSTSFCMCRGGGVVFGMRTVTGYRDGSPSLSFLSWVPNMKHECHSFCIFFFLPSLSLSWALRHLLPTYFVLPTWCQCFLCFVLHMPNYANTVICLFFYLDYILFLNTLRFFKFFYDM